MATMERLEKNGFRAERRSRWWSCGIVPKAEVSAARPMNQADLSRGRVLLV